MKKTLLLLPALLALTAPSLLAAELPPVIPADQMQSWHAHTLLAAVANVLLFAAIGIAAAVIGYKLFDKCTPGDLHKEILEHRREGKTTTADRHTNKEWWEVGADDDNMRWSDIPPAIARRQDEEPVGRPESYGMAINRL